jgi:hypothetical protein
LPDSAFALAVAAVAAAAKPYWTFQPKLVLCDN